MNFRIISALGAALLFATAAAPAAMLVDDGKLTCPDKPGDSNRHRVCEIRESSMPVTGNLNVDAAPNGGIRISGWDKSQIFVRARVEAWGDSDSESEARLKQVMVITSGSKVSSDGPKSSNFLGGGDRKWSVSFEIFVPKKIDLKLETVNGGITVGEVHGNMNIETVNGGVHLNGVSGKVKGETVNGGLNVDLAGSTWEGEGLNLEAVNGGVTVNVPAAYNASFHAETVNGGINTDFPGATMEGKWGPKKMDLKTGAGGPQIKVETVNGGVKIRKKA